VHWRNAAVFNYPPFAAYSTKYIERDYRRTDEHGRKYRIDNLQGPGGAKKATRIMR
jgi:hypothetical protein